MIEGDVVRIPLLDQLVSAGPGAFDQASASDTGIPLPLFALKQLGLKPEDVRWVTVSGGSMKPAFQPGQHVLVALHKGEPLQDGSVYVFQFEDSLFVKRYHFKRGVLRFRGDNDEEYLEIGPDEREYLRLIGRVAYTATFV